MRWAEASGAALVLTLGGFWFEVGPLVVAGAVALGMVVHVLGGALTVAGVPLAWPLRVRGARWLMVGAPLRFRTGRESLAEEIIRWVSLGTTPAWLLIGLLLSFEDCGQFLSG